MYDPFYLLWAFSLKAVRDQWRRIALMQTNREDCGSRYKEIVIPKPPRVSWAKDKSEAFRSYFEGIAKAMGSFRHKVGSDNFEYTANVNSNVSRKVVNGRLTGIGRRIGTPKAHIVGGAQYLEGRYASLEGWMVVGGARGIVGG